MIGVFRIPGGPTMAPQSSTTFEPGGVVPLGLELQVNALLVDLFLEAHQRAPREIVLDLENTDIPLHGEQEGRFFHGYGACPRAGKAGLWKRYCYLPLSVFCGRHLLLARQRRANVAGSDSAV